MKKVKLRSSFRDLSGFVFEKEGRVLRQVNKVYKKDYDLLISSGLYNELVSNQLLISHSELGGNLAFEKSISYKVIEPKKLDFISYPYEWCFSQLKDAGLLTLRIQKLALKHGLTLKDASAYNIQFYKGRPVFIDTLSFEKYHEGEPWVAYRQFCQHFLAPLVLVSFKDPRFTKLLRVFIDGFPLSFVSKLIPKRTWLNLGLLTHIHLHARSQSYYANKKIVKKKITKVGLRGIVDNLESTLKSLSWNPEGTQWAEYYSFTNYNEEAFVYKKRIVNSFIDTVKPKIVLDLGANTGVFSRIASSQKIVTISVDNDPAAVERNYLESKKNKEEYILPLIIDLENPSPAIGWMSEERTSFIERRPFDLVMSLALLHHLSISNNLPFDNVADFFKKVGRFLIIEFIPKKDSQVQRLLTSRKDIFGSYSIDNFEYVFAKHFRIIRKEKIPASERVLYLMCKK